MGGALGEALEACTVRGRSVEEFVQLERRTLSVDDGRV